MFIEVFYIFGRTIIGLMPVPGREIDCEFNAILFAGIRQFADNVSFSVFVRSVADTVLCQLRRPQTESIVMFRCQDHSFHAGFDKCLYPLLTVQTGRVECFRIGVSISPFTVVECVKSEVYKRIRFHFLPFHLFGFGNG